MLCTSLLFAQATTPLPGNLPGVEDYDVVVRVSWNYSREYLREGPNEKVEEKFEFMAKKDYVGLLRRSLNKQAPNYWFDWTRPEPLDVQTVAFESLDDNPEARTQCNQAQWKDVEDLGLTGQGGEVEKPLLVLLRPTVDLTCRCLTQYKDEKEGIWDTERSTGECGRSDDMGLVLTPNDLDQLLKEHYWSKTYRGFFKVDQALAEADPKTLPEDKVIVTQDEEGTFYRGEIKLEIFLEPQITGPHYLAHLNPKQTAPGGKNEITLRVSEIPNWHVEPILPVKGWGFAQQFVKKEGETGAPAPTLTLAPVQPGKVLFEAKWTSPKGKKGKTKSFEVTVVELTFKKPTPCIGFDDTLDHPQVPAVSVCQVGEKQLQIDIKPAGTSAPAKLEANTGGLTVTPNTFNQFPQPITLRGVHKTKTKLAAAIEVEPGKTQRSAELFVDVLEPLTLKIQPVVFETPLALTPDVDLMFNNSSKYLDQACVKIERLPVWKLTRTMVPDYQEGSTLLYNGTGQDVLKRYANERLNHGQDITAFFVPNIVTREVDASGNVSYIQNPHGFQIDKFVFAKTTSEFPNMLAHEIGHYLWKDMYASFESAVHTQDYEMLMHMYIGPGCEIRQREWREIHPSGR